MKKCLIISFLLVTILIIAFFLFSNTIQKEVELRPNPNDSNLTTDEYFEELRQYYKKHKGTKEELLFSIEPYTKKCQGLIERDCLVVKSDDEDENGFFYETIQGFDFVEGFSYLLKVEREQKYDWDDVPQDAGVYEYKLVEILEKNAVEKQ